MPIGPISGIAPGSRIVALKTRPAVPVSTMMLGRVLDGMGNPIDDKGPIDPESEYPLYVDPINPLKELRLSIGYKEATLTVSGPAGAQVLVNGVPRGRTNETLRIPMTGPTPVAAQVTVRVEGQPGRVQRVTLEAGKAANLVL